MKKSNVIAALFFVAVCLVSCNKNSETAEEESTQENVETKLDNQQAIDKTIEEEEETQAVEEVESESKIETEEKTVETSQK